MIVSSGKKKKKKTRIEAEDNNLNPNYNGSKKMNQL